MAELWDDVVGQQAAIGQLRASARAPVHAYLLVGPPGTGKRAGARSFAAALLCADGGCGACRSCTLARAEAHPDLVVRERTGARISIEDARELSRLAARSPIEGDRKVLLVVDLHLAADIAPALLKTIEEPPPSTVFVLLAETVPPEMVTIASRCVTVPFGPLPSELIAETLTAEGVAADVAAEVAGFAGGRLDRARMLASDPGFSARQATWRSVPGRLDGTGHSVMALADELLAASAAALEHVVSRQADERAALEARVAEHGERGSGRKELEERHKREQRRVRLDEYRAGMATLTLLYRDRLAGDSSGEAARGCIDAIAALHEAGEALIRNPNEPLLLQGLLIRLNRVALAVG